MCSSIDVRSSIDVCSSLMCVVLCDVRSSIDECSSVDVVSDV